MADGVNQAVLRGKRVLVVEDEALITMLFEEILADLACDMVGPAPDLRHAIELARTADIDVAVIDLNLAGQSSLPVAEILRDRRVPTILMSGYGSNTLQAEWRSASTLPKPFTADQVAKALSAALDG